MKRIKIAVFQAIFYECVSWISRAHLGGSDLLFACILGSRCLIAIHLRSGAAERITLRSKVYDAAPTLDVSSIFL